MGDGEIMYSIKKVCFHGMSLRKSLLTELFCPALDQIITQIMENSNSTAPVPASGEVMENLPRDVLEEGCMQTVFYHLFIPLTTIIHSPAIAEGLCRLQRAIQIGDRRP